MMGVFDNYLLMRDPALNRTPPFESQTIVRGVRKDNGRLRSGVIFR
jgi:hypothetical protein